MELVAWAIVPTGCITVVVEVVSFQGDSELRRLTRACDQSSQRNHRFICENCGCSGRTQGSRDTRIVYSCPECGRVVGLDQRNRLSVLHSGDVKMAVVHA